MTSDDEDARRVLVESEGFAKTKLQDCLKIDAGVLLGGRTYDFSVVAKMRYDPAVQTTVNLVVKAEWSPLVPIIAGGS